MTLDFSKGGAFIVHMEDYLKEILKDLPDDINDTATTPTTDRLFKVRANAPKLNEERAEFVPSCGGTAAICCAARSTRPPNSGFLFDQESPGTRRR